MFFDSLIQYTTHHILLTLYIDLLLTQAISQLTKNTVMKGAAISPRLLKQRNRVKRGQSVIILAKNAVIQVRSQGVALSDGAIGEIIRVRNRLTKKIVEGTITSEGLVEIPL